MKIDSETTWICLDCAWGMGKPRTMLQAINHQELHAHAVTGPVEREIAQESAANLQGERR